MQIHEIRSALSKVNMDLHGLELATNCEVLNANLYEAAKGAIAEFEWLYRLTGHGCFETTNRLRHAVDQYELAKQYAQN
jgi:hypothetical protein